MNSWIARLSHRSIRGLLAGGIVALAVLGLKAAFDGAAAGSRYRIVFFGDSITEQAEYRRGFISLLRAQLPAMPDGRRPLLIGAGRSGNRVPDLERRLERDVLARKPDEVVIFIGINDVWHSLRGSGTPLPDYETGLRRLIERIKAQGVTVTLCTPTAIGEQAGGANPLDIQLDEYSDAVRRIAAAEGLVVVDLRKAFCERINAADEGVQPTADAARPPLTNDGVHLSAAGNALVADQLLEHFEARAAEAR